MGKKKCNHTLTFTPGERVAPLPVGLAGGLARPVQNISRVAHEAHGVVQVELGALGQPEGGVTGVTTGDG